jgi:hypothetical protein
MHLWVQNTGHTWKAVADGLPIAPVSGSIRVPGFEARRKYDVEWWDTWNEADPDRNSVVADSTGTLVLEVNALPTDIAVTIRPAASPVGR